MLILAQLALVGVLAPLSHGSLAGDDGRSRSPWSLIIQRPPGTEAASADVGDLLTIVGWSPASFKGVRYQLVVRSDRPDSSAFLARCRNRISATC